MADDGEKELRDLRERLVTLETATRSDRRWMMLVGVLLLAVLGYSSFIGLPNEVQRQLPGAVTKEVNRAAPERVEAEFEAWLEANSGEALLDNIRETQVEVSNIEARAKADSKEIQAFLEAQKGADLEERVAALEVDIANLAIKPASCRWLCGSDWCNAYQAPFSATCRDDEIVAGIKSTFEGQHRDRAFNLYCCKVASD